LGQADNDDHKYVPDASELRCSAPIATEIENSDQDIGDSLSIPTV
jgi:hypothetical protein